MKKAERSLRPVIPDLLYIESIWFRTVLSLLPITAGDIAIGPGLFFGVDGRETTPKFGVGLTLTF